MVTWLETAVVCSQWNWQSKTAWKPYQLLFRL